MTGLFKSAQLVQIMLLTLLGGHRLTPGPESWTKELELVAPVPSD